MLLVCLPYLVAKLPYHLKTGHPLGRIDFHRRKHALDPALVKRCVVPTANVREGAVIDGIEIIGVNTLSETIEYLQEVLVLERLTQDFDGIVAKLRKLVHKENASMCQ